MIDTLSLQTEGFAYEIMQAKLGVRGMEMLDNQLEAWHLLVEKTDLSSPLRDSFKDGDIRLPEGTLLHSMGMHSLFDAEALKGVANLGIVSGELIGKVEDSETHGCADFFRVSRDTNITDYMAFSKELIVKRTANGGKLRMQRGERLLSRGVTFIVDPKAEGMDVLLQRDGYRDPEMQGFILPPDGRTAEDTAAILGGVPSGVIAGVILGPGAIKNPENIETTNRLFPNLPIFNVAGERI